MPYTVPDDDRELYIEFLNEKLRKINEQLADLNNQLARVDKQLANARVKANIVEHDHGKASGTTGIKIRRGWLQKIDEVLTHADIPLTSREIYDAIVEADKFSREHPDTAFRSITSMLSQESKNDKRYKKTVKGKKSAFEMVNQKRAPIEEGKK